MEKSQERTLENCLRPAPGVVHHRTVEGGKAGFLNLNLIL